MDQSTFDKLERLAKLRANGALSDSEYDVEKAKLLAAGPAMNPSVSLVEPRVEAPIDEAKLAPIWRERFRLIDEHGMPNSRAHSIAMQNVGTWERVTLALSPLAFLLGPFYLLYLGLWRPAISLTAATLVFSAVTDAIGIPAWLDRITYLVPSAVFAFVCIPLYYLRVRRGIHSWNPMIWWAESRA
jgi:hypothetical protein